MIKENDHPAPLEKSPPFCQKTHDSPSREERVRAHMLAQWRSRDAHGLDRTAYTLDKAVAALYRAEHPRDFKEILAEQAHVLGAGFDYFLTTAAQSGSAHDKRVMLALKMQSQLTRTIDTWRRLENAQNERTK